MTTKRDNMDFPTWASNFYPSEFTWDGRLYADAESAFQSAKTLDPKLRDKFAADVCRGPGKAKQLGRSLQLREDWEHVKDDVMLDILRAKFDQNSEIRRALLINQNYLVEWTMWHDNHWGVCLCGRSSCNGGRNRLGSLLMQLRSELRGGPPVNGRDVPMQALNTDGTPARFSEDMVAGRGDEDWVAVFAGDSK